MVLGYSYDGVDLREHPEAYRVGRGEQGAFHAEPYKGELLPLWGFKDVETARGSACAIYGKFLEYRDAGDFVGMDVARKYLQRGYTRSRRYAKYGDGRKSRPLERGPGKGPGRGDFLQRVAAGRGGRGISASKGASPAQPGVVSCVCVGE